MNHGWSEASACRQCVCEYHLTRQFVTGARLQSAFKIVSAPPLRRCPVSSLRATRNPPAPGPWPNRLRNRAQYFAVRFLDSVIMNCVACSGVIDARARSQMDRTVEVDHCILVRRLVAVIRGRPGGRQGRAGAARVGVNRARPAVGPCCCGSAPVAIWPSPTRWAS